MVYNLDIQWACCECVPSKKGNLSKYQIKVLCILKSKFANGTIVKVCRTLYKTRGEGVSALCKPPSPAVFSPRSWSNASKDNVDTSSLYYVHMDTSQDDDMMEPIKTLDD